MDEAFIARSAQKGLARKIWLGVDDSLTLEASGKGEGPDQTPKARPLKILRREPNGLLVVLWGETVVHGTVTREGSGATEKTYFQVNDSVWELSCKPEAVDEMEQAAAQAAAASGSLSINSPIPGLIKAVSVKVGDEVEEGQTVLILEAMKMENEIPVPHAGIVEAVQVKEGKTVAAGELLLKLKV